VRFDLTLALADRPGQLLKAFRPIATHGGNIISIIHEREKYTGNYVPVSLVVDFPSSESFSRARRDLEDLGVTVIRSEEVIEKANITAILIGKLDLGKVLDSRVKGLRIVSFEVSAPTSKEACVKLNIEAPVESIDETVRELKRIAKEERAILVTSI